MLFAEINVQKYNHMPKISLNGFLDSMDLRCSHTNVKSHEDLQLPILASVPTSSILIFADPIQTPNSFVSSSTS